MKLFTPQERKAIWSLLILLAIGLIARQVRRSRAVQMPLAQDGYTAVFQAGAEAYRATSIDEPVAPINLNVTTVAELQLLPGIGPVMAKKIIDYRLKNGYFQSVDDLINVEGVGPKRMEQWRDLLLVSNGALQSIKALTDSVQLQE